jgi:hypothetical protein
MTTTKTATKKLSAIDAQKIVDQLESKAAELAETRASDERELASISFAAHASEDQKALARLETIKARAVKRELDARSLDAAIAEAKRRVVDAQNAEARAEAAKVAEEVAEIAGSIREEGAKADKALAQFIAAANNVKKCIVGLQQRGLGSPNSAQLQALGRRAILGALVDSPFAKEFEHVAPRERQNFAQFTSSWAAAIENAVGAKAKKEVAA